MESRENVMKQTIASLALLGALAVLPLSAHAIMTDAQATAMVQQMLEDGRSSTEIIETLMEDGRSLEDATVLGVKTATGHAKMNLARVGICLAEDVTRAEEVARACVDVCEPDTKEIIESLIEGYVTGACDPPEYEYSSTPSGGGSVSPSS
jgi:hypothetical protein